MNLPDRYPGSATGLGPLSAAMIAPGHEAQFDRLNLGAIVAIFRRRFWLLVRVVLLCLALAVLVTINMPVLYQANADVELHTLPASSSNDQTAGQTLDDPGGVRIDAVDTELQIIKSRELASKVFDRAKLGQDKLFMKEALTKSGITAILRRMVFIDPGPKKGASKPNERRELVLDYMTGQVDAQRIVTTAYAAHIYYSDVDPVRAATIANAYATAYASDQSEDKQSNNDQAITALKARIDALGEQATADYAREQRYRIDHSLLSANANQLTEQEVSTYNQEVATARAEAAHDRADYANAHRQLLSGSGAAGEVQSAPLIATLREQRATISAHLADLSSRFLDTHPDVAASRQQLRDIDAQIAAEVNRTLQMLDAKAQASEQRLASLQGSLHSANGTLSHNNSALIALDDLHRRSQASQQTYDTYLARYATVMAKSGVALPDSRTISLARPPVYPSSPIWLLNIGLGLILGLGLGGSAAVLAETNFSGLTTGLDVETRLGLPFVGGVPKLTSIKPHSASALQTIADYPGGAFAEALRGVVMSARRSPNGRNQILAVTSALPNEGKTTIAACMAMLAGMAGERVCVIDCDTIRRNLSRLYPAATIGLRDYLDASFTAATELPTDERGLVSYIGNLGDFPEGRRLNEAGRFHRLLAKLRERYDLILLDLPPVLPIAEARELAALADNTLLVAQWRKSKVDALRAALKLLPLHDISYVGVILNNINMRKRMQIDGAESFYRQYRKYYLERA